MSLYDHTTNEPDYDDLRPGCCETGECNPLVCRLCHETLCGDLVTELELALGCCTDCAPKAARALVKERNELQIELAALRGCAA